MSKQNVGVTSINGAMRIMYERLRQVEKEGYSKEHDSKHRYGEIIMAAVAYANAAHHQILNPSLRPEELCVSEWPWENTAWNPSDKPTRNLEKAGALIAAEIDRLLEEP